MTVQQLRTEYAARYANDAYANDEGTQNLFRVLDAAHKLSPAAQREFCKAFSFEFALEGQVYVTSQRRLLALYPNLGAEAEAVGLTLAMR